MIVSGGHTLLQVNTVGHERPRDGDRLLAVVTVTESDLLL